MSNFFSYVFVTTIKKEKILEKPNIVHKNTNILAPIDKHLNFQ